MMLAATYIVLALPVAIFMGGWFRPWISIPAIVTLGVAGFLSRRGSLASPPPSLSPAAMFSAFGVSVFWLCMSGAGGIGWQQGDWLKHYSVLLGLMSHSWPVLYGPDEPLVYYLAYYLLPALAGKTAGWQAAQAVLAIETWLVYFLAALWVARWLGRHAVAGLLLFTCFSGLDVVGSLLVRHQWELNSWWAKIVQYSCPADLMMFVPQHLAIGWLGTAAVLECDRAGKPHLAVCILSLSPCWSPFVTVGLAPFVLYTWWRHRGWRTNLVLQVAAAVAVFLPLVIFLQARSTIFDSITWWMTGMRPPTFILFLFLEWFVFAVVLLLAEGQRFFARPFVVLSFAILGAIPLVSLPGYADYVMRASIPALFIVALAVVGAGLEGMRRRQLRVVPLWGVFLLGAIHPVGLYYESVNRFTMQLPQRDEIPQIPDLNPTGKRVDGLQYVGHKDSLFFEYFARRS